MGALPSPYRTPFCLGTGHLLRGGGVQIGRRGVASEVLPPQKGGGAEKVLAMPKWSTKRFEVVLPWEPEVLAILMGGVRTKFSPFKRGGGGAKSFTLSQGGGAKSFGPTIFPFCSPPSP